MSFSANPHNNTPGYIKHAVTIARSEIAFFENKLREEILRAGKEASLATQEHHTYLLSLIQLHKDKAMELASAAGKVPIDRLQREQEPSDITCRPEGLELVWRGLTYPACGAFLASWEELLGAQL